MKHAILLATAVLALLVPGASSATGITARMREEDPRLGTRATLRSSTSLADLLAQLGKATGVVLTADRSADATHESVACFVDSIPLGDLLDGLWSLLSYDEAGWHWERSGRPGAYVYRLYQPLRAQRLPERLRVLAQDAVERQAVMLLAAAELPDEKRDTVIRKHAKDRLLGLDDPRAVDALAARKTGWDTLRVCTAGLGSDGLTGMLRAHTSRDVPLTALPEWVGKWASEHPMGLPAGPGLVLQGGASSPMTPEPTGVRLQVTRPRGSLTPELRVGVYTTAASGTSAGLVTCAGDFRVQGAFARMLRKLWLQPGDAPANQEMDGKGIAVPKARQQAERAWVSAQVTGQPIGPQAAEQPDPLLGFADVAIGVPVPLLVRLSMDEAKAPWPKQDQKVGAYLSSLTEAVWPLWMHKWRGRLLLLAADAWFWRGAQ